MRNDGLSRPLPATPDGPPAEGGRRKLRRISRRASPLVGLLAVITAAGILFVEASAPAGTFALFGAATNNGSSFAAVAVYAPPANPTTGVLDTSVNLTWPAAQPNNNGNGNGYAVSGLNIQPPTVAAPSCAGQSYGTSTFRAGVAPASPNTTYTDALSALAAASTVQNFAGSWSCFQVLTGYSTTAPASWSQVPGISGAGTQGWYSVQNPRTAGTRIGFFSDSIKDPGDAFIVNQAISSVAVPGAGAPHTLVNNDVFTLTFAAPTNTPAYTGSICVSTTGPQMWLADWKANCATDEVGTLSGGTIVSGGGAAHQFTVTWTWTSSSVLTGTITNVNGHADKISGSWAFTASGPTDDEPVQVGQTFVVHYNQATNKPDFNAVGDSICFTKSGVGGVQTLFLARTGGCHNATTDDVGFLLGGTTIKGFGVSDTFGSSYAWSVDGLTLTVTITNLNFHNDDLGGTWTFEPSTTGPNTLVKSADATVSVCSPPSTGQLLTQLCWPFNS